VFLESLALPLSNAKLFSFGGNDFAVGMMIPDYIMPLAAERGESPPR
jgi:hypothetical protein